MAKTVPDQLPLPAGGGHSSSWREVEHPTGQLEAWPGYLDGVHLRVFSTPFVRSLTVELPRGDWQTVELVDALGRRVATLPNGPCASSSCRLTWDATDAAPGVYTVWATGPSGTARQHVVRAR